MFYRKTQVHRRKWIPKYLHKSIHATYFYHQANQICVNLFLDSYVCSTYFHILKSLNTYFHLKICPQNANVIFYWRVYFAVWKSYELLWRKRLRAFHFQLKFVKKWVKNNVRFICLHLQIWPMEIDSMDFFFLKDRNFTTTIWKLWFDC